MSTTYLDTHSDLQYERWRRDICIYCGLHSSGDCYARFCDSCTQYWLSNVPADGDDGRPREADCPDCVAAEEEQAEQEYKDSLDAQMTERERLGSGGYWREGQ